MPDISLPAKRLLVSTRNAHKLGEIRAILGSEYNVCGLDVLADFPEVEETGDTFEENAALKAVAASRVFPGYVLADDSGLVVDALGGDPGVRSARYAGESAADADNNALLLKNLADVPTEHRTARFECIMVLALGGKVEAVFRGVVEGRILESPSGVGGFGYDPLFLPEGYSESFAALGGEIKNRISHRARALEALRMSDVLKSEKFAEFSGFSGCFFGGEL